MLTDRPESAPAAATPSTHGAVTGAVGDRDRPDRIELIDATSLSPEPVSWVWEGWLARGKLHVLAGAPGTGKTTLAMDWAAATSAGLFFPSGVSAPRGRVLIWSGEDDPKDTLLPRLIAAGADLSNIQFVGRKIREGGSCPFDPALDVPLLAKAAGEDVAMIIVDPLVSAVAGDSHKNAEVRRSLAPLVELASRLNAVLLGITHYSKGTQAREPLERVSGSLAFAALARIVFGTVREKSVDESNKTTMKLARAKSNIGSDGGGFKYSFEQIELPDHPGINASRIVWGPAIEGSARNLLSDELPDESNTPSTVDFLRSLLAEGPMAATEVYKAAWAEGISEQQAKRAKSKAGIEAIKDGMHGGWWWRLKGVARTKGSDDPSLNIAIPSYSSEDKSASLAVSTSESECSASEAPRFTQSTEAVDVETVKEIAVERAGRFIDDGMQVAEADEAALQMFKDEGTRELCRAHLLSRA